MTFFSSLRSRIFVTSAVLAVLSIAAAIYLVNARVTREAERTLQREIRSTASQFDQLRATRTETFAIITRFMADTPHLKAAVTTDDPLTVQAFMLDFESQLNESQLKSNLLMITNKAGHVLARFGTPERAALVIASHPAIRNALGGRESVNLVALPDGVLQLITVPIVTEPASPQILGTLSVGFLLDNALAEQLKQNTGSEIAFGIDGQILAATLPADARPALAEALGTKGVSTVRIGSQEYVALPRALQPGNAGATGAGPVALILRSRTEQLAFLDAIHTELAGTALVAVILATLLSFAVARTITRPLAAITDVMHEVASTGDLTRKIALRHNQWDDEDARLLATTFNTLTESVGHFQREISQKERLSSLGRLSTVIAHEVRNPLMIIKASLHTLRQPAAGAAAMREAVTDIDEEVARLNRIVNEVLDFARPIHFELGQVDLNALCRESAAAAEAAGAGAPIALMLDHTAPTITTDGERLRIALVNMLVNARHAVNGDGARTAPANAGPAADAVTLATRVFDRRVTITVTDRGAGIDAVDLARVFDPYFTTKRGGTGLGLPISKNIIEGLGGAIGITSAPGRGTEIRIDLPLQTVIRPTD
jgi:signal transduction histidine kinase